MSNRVPRGTYLSQRGKYSYQWASTHMRILEKIKSKNQSGRPLSGYRLGFCLHVTKETSVLIMAAKELGAEIALCSANPLSVQDDIAAFLASEGVTVFAWKGETPKDYKDCILKVLKFKPDILTDDGAELHIAAHRANTKNVVGGTEETTSGVNRLQSLESKRRLLYPVIKVNNAKTKYMFDNKYGTGQSTIDGILRSTGLFLPGKHVVICGYGWVGKGVSCRARGMGAIVTVTEVDPLKALEAHIDGFGVRRLVHVAASGDIFITCTGQTDVIREEHIKRMKNGAVLANAGHFDVEIDVNYIYSKSCSPVIARPNVEAITISGKRIYLLSKGRVINLIGAEGHPPEVMGLSFANQLLSIIFISNNYSKMRNQTYDVPFEIDNAVANYALKAMNIKIDSMTERQLLYRSKWE
ncbi:MAG: adenosylhomocysteinase [Nitrososphaeraceae archaeon]